LGKIVLIALFLGSKFNPHTHMRAMIGDIKKK